MFVFALSVGLTQSMLQEGYTTCPTASGRGIVYPLPLSPPKADA